jgi:hypothetical protein
MARKFDRAVDARVAEWMKMHDEMHDKAIG